MSIIKIAGTKKQVKEFNLLQRCQVGRSQNLGTRTTKSLKDYDRNVSKKEVRKRYQLIDGG